MDARRKRPGHVEVARQRRGPGRHRQPAGRRSRAPVGGVGRFPRGCGRVGSADAARRRKTIARFAIRFATSWAILYDFDPQADAVPFDKMEALDQYMLRQTCAFAARRAHWYDEFAFHKIYHRVNHFCIVDLSAFYFDVLKDRLYTSAPKSRAAVARRLRSGASAKRWCGCWRRS